MSVVQVPTPEVTVAISVYSPRYISQALDSILTQTFQNFEIIVVNDGSPETETLERVLEPYQSRIRYIRQQNAGVSVARNTAVHAARAPLILNFDHDDVAEPDLLKTQVEFMQAHPEIDAAYVDMLYFGGSRCDGTRWMQHYPSAGEVSFHSVLAGRTCPSCPGSVVRREMLLRVGMFDAAFRSWGDFDLWLRILYAGGSVAFHTKALVRYRAHAASLTSNRLPNLENAMRVLDKVEATMHLTPEEAAALAVRRNALLFDLEILRGKAALRQRVWSEAIRHFEYCQRQAPTAKLRAVLLALHCSPRLAGAALGLRTT